MTPLFTGTFDPFTRGHADIVSRALAICDGPVIIGIGVNSSKPSAAAAADERAVAIRHLYRANERVRVITFEGLAVDAARACGADCLLRGFRSPVDADYEMQMADINRRLTGIDTLLLPARPELAAVSSSTVRELRAFGADVDPFLPTPDTSSHPQ